MNIQEISGAHFGVHGRVVMRRIGEDRLLVPVSGTAAGGCVYPVNETAAAIWTCLAAGKTVQATAATLMEAYAVSDTEALQDVEASARAFVEEGLLDANG